MASYQTVHVRLETNTERLTASVWWESAGESEPVRRSLPLPVYYDDVLLVKTSRYATKHYYKRG